MDIVDVRHEQSAVFAAEGWAKATREVGVCAVTAGPGVTNGMSGMASALQNGSPVFVLGWPCAGLPLGPGLAPGDRPCALRRARDQERGHGGSRPRRFPGLVDDALRGPPSRRPGPRSSTCRSIRCSWRPTSTPTPRPSWPDPRSLEAADGAALDRAAELLRGRRAAGGHGGHRPLLGPRRRGAGAALRGALRSPFS